MRVARIAGRMFFLCFFFVVIFCPCFLRTYFFGEYDNVNTLSPEVLLGIDSELHSKTQESVFIGDRRYIVVVEKDKYTAREPSFSASIILYSEDVSGNKRQIGNLAYSYYDNHFGLKKYGGISWITLERSYQNKGLGEYLLKRAIKDIQNQGATTICFEKCMGFDEINPAIVGLATKYGFKPIANLVYLFRDENIESYKFFQDNRIEIRLKKNYLQSSSIHDPEIVIVLLDQKGRGPIDLTPYRNLARKDFIEELRKKVLDKQIATRGDYIKTDVPEELLVDFKRIIRSQREAIRMMKKSHGSMGLAVVSLKSVNPEIIYSHTRPKWSLLRFLDYLTSAFGGIRSSV